MYLAVVVSIENPMSSTNLNKLNSEGKRRFKEPEIDTMKKTEDLHY
ncbi:hypothetical protein J1605_019179 [Eschrichtius robustus]|uniref:Uncharacterized protein n=1 Tax=Eschrichtius robustus TaxID=9764 RepID=A0AB34HNH1_ESCRO|nr:hypothetical protein J1605_019179 [Eschrichtius robustus]